MRKRGDREEGIRETVKRRERDGEAFANEGRMIGRGGGVGFGRGAGCSPVQM